LTGGYLDALAAPRYLRPMAKEIPSVGDLRRKSEISDAEIEAVTDAYLKDEAAPPFAFSSGHKVDVAKAIDMHPQAKKLLADEATTPGLRRTMVKTAIILGFPVSG
jgi:hypothetical protein